MTTTSNIAQIHPATEPAALAGVAMTGAEMVVRALKDQGVDTLFGYPGGAVLPIYDALFSDDDVRHILVRHEQGAQIPRLDPELGELRAQPLIRHRASALDQHGANASIDHERQRRLGNTEVVGIE